MQFYGHSFQIHITIKKIMHFLLFQVFYRLHVVVLKCVMKKVVGEKFDLMKTYLSEAAESPFAKCKEKKWDKSK